MRTHKNIIFYNVIFPIWLLLLIPFSWVIVLPINYVIDLFVIIVTLAIIGVSEKRKLAKSIILKVWIFGFIADIIGAIFMLLITMIPFPDEKVFREWWYHNIVFAVSYDPLANQYAFLWTTFCVLVSMCFIYFFNFKICLKKTSVDKAAKIKLSLALAIFTAPYLFYFPMIDFI